MSDSLHLNAPTDLTVSRFYLRSRLRMKGDLANRHSERLRADGNRPQASTQRWTKLSRPKAALASTGNASAFSRISVTVETGPYCTASMPGPYGRAAILKVVQHTV